MNRGLYLPFTLPCLALRWYWINDHWCYVMFVTLSTPGRGQERGRRQEHYRARHRHHGELLDAVHRPARQQGTVQYSTVFTLSPPDQA